jgi:hypothetical protein
MRKLMLAHSLCAALLAFGCAAPSGEKKVENNAQASRLAEEHALYRAGYADSVNTGLIAVDDFKSSARRMTEATFEGGTVTVNYGSPGKRGRVIWNGLVAYNQVWVSGAHWATAVTFSNPVRIANTEIPAGMYGFFTIPGPDEWVLILNKNFDQHLADEYKEEEDLVRITVTPTALDNVVQRLTYEVIGGENAGSILLSWDQIQVEMPFEFIDNAS